MLTDGTTCGLTGLSRVGTHRREEYDNYLCTSFILSIVSSDLDLF